MMNMVSNVAVLIDADNVSPAWIEQVLHEASTLGVLALKRVYGDFSHNEKSWKELCARLAIQPVQQFPNTKGKNASDIALVIDAMDLLHSKRYSSFCLVSSDSDFSRLATRLREDGVQVWGFGEQKTPEAFVKACTKFVYVEILHAADEEEAKSDEISAASPACVLVPGIKPRHLDRQAVGDVPSVTLRRLDKTLRQQFCEVIELAGDEEGWAHLGEVGSMLGKRMPDFDARNYGFKKLSELVTQSGWFDVRKPTAGKGVVMICLKSNGKKTT